VKNCECISPADTILDDRSYQILTSGLNESQNNAIRDCLSGIHCSHSSTVKLVWGPPGTGKTKTLGTLLYVLMKMRYRILVCAPTNVAIKEVASRVLRVVRESLGSQVGDLACSPGNILLFGNNEKLDVGGEDIEDIFLDSRVQQLRKCLSPYTGWRHCFDSMINLLKYCVSDYQMFENEIIRLKKSGIKGYTCKSFPEFLREKFRSRALQLKDCISMLCTHVPKCLILEHNYRNLVCLNETLESFQILLSQEHLSSDELKTLFRNLEMPEDSSWYSKNAAAQNMFKKRNQCLSALETAKDSLDRLELKRFTDDHSVRDFCFENASVIFCTTSSSFRLHKVSMKPINLLVIDEAAQLKECESVIPLQLPEISHAILVGDECQLPAMVRSNVCSEAGFGRSLFERLSLLGSHKNLLNMQHRMHPQISLFPNSHFYNNKIRDAPHVERNYGKQYLPGPMFGPYSFINVAGGREEYDDDGRSYKNMAEVAVVMTILKNLHKAWLATKEKLSIGIVSPYAGQVLKIQEKLARMNDIIHDGFDVNVKSIDGFQGGERDIIILSTVRTNYRTSLQFVSSRQRTNVALTRARYCLWILGNERALASSDNVWKSLVLDSKNRGFFFHADRDTEMAKAIFDSIKELDQSLDLLDTNSVIFRNTLWKVHFSDRFRRSFKRVRTQQSKNSVINVLERLATGWRPRGRSIEFVCEKSSKILKQFKVESRYIICSIEIVKDLRGHF
ncbi:regulator of nonsense transcripts-like protein, partial [Trifolium pratense]